MFLRYLLSVLGVNIICFGSEGADELYVYQDERETLMI